MQYVYLYNVLVLEHRIHKFSDETLSFKDYTTIKLNCNSWKRLQALILKRVLMCVCRTNRTARHRTPGPTRVPRLAGHAGLPGHARAPGAVGTARTM